MMLKLLGLISFVVSLKCKSNTSSYQVQNNFHIRGIYQERFFQQKLDKNINRYFRQRYFVNADYYRPGGPAFLYISGEQAASNQSISDGLIVRLAKDNGGIIYTLEHRFYGISQPFKLLTTRNLRFLSSGHAIQDIVNFAKNVINPITNQHNTKWYVLGGSYAGSLAAWVRKSHPYLFKAALASSAPLQAKEDFFEYDESIKNTLGPICSSTMERIVNYIDEIYISNPKLFDSLKRRLGCQNLKNDIHFLYTIYDTISSIVQYNNPNSQPSVASLCDGFLNATNVAEHFFHTLEEYYNSFQINCMLFSNYEDIKSEHIMEFSMMRQWTYQSCTEFGFWQTAPRQNSMRSRFLTVKWFNHYFCYGNFFSKYIGPPKIYATNSQYGGRYIDTNHIIFTNGDQDPWAALSINDTKYYSPHRPVFLIKDGSHVTDLGPTSPQDSPAIVETKYQVRKVFYNWINLNN